MQDAVTYAKMLRMTALAPYERIKQSLKLDLAKGVWPTGASMPSENVLSAQFGVSRMTVNRALRELQSEGLVDRVQGVGTFAAHLHRVSSTLTIRDIHEEILARGHTHRAQVVLARAEKAGVELAASMELTKGSRVFHTVIVHFENELPLQCEDRYVNPACAPDYLLQDFTTITPTHYLLQVAPLWEAKFRLEAGLPTEEEAQWLGLTPGSPCLILNRRTSNRGITITQARLTHPADRYQIEGAFKP
jgi:GntR family transcriptional regulator, histidine utilization repressor